MLTAQRAKDVIFKLSARDTVLRQQAIELVFAKFTCEFILERGDVFDNIARDTAVYANTKLVSVNADNGIC